MTVVSAAALRDAVQLWNDAPQLWLECLTFDHPSLTSPIRLVNDKADLVRTAGTFIAFPFTWRDRVQADEQTVTGMIVADNVDQRIIQSLRGITGRPTVTYEAVLYDSPNTVERGPMEFEVIGFQTNMTTISLSVAFAFSFLGEAFPKDYTAPWNATAI
jgi:hypothetical protein